MQYLKYNIQLSFLSEEVKSFVDGLLVSLFRTHDGFFPIHFHFFLWVLSRPVSYDLFLRTLPFQSHLSRSLARQPYLLSIFFFILFLFVCLLGGSYEGKVNEFKQSKQTKKRTKRTRYVFFSALLPEPPAQSKGNRKRSYALFNR